MFLFSPSLSYQYSNKRRLHVIYSFVKDYLECERPHIEIYAHISLFSHAPSLSPLHRSADTMTPHVLQVWNVTQATSGYLGIAKPVVISGYYSHVVEVTN